LKAYLQLMHRADPAKKLPEEFADNAIKQVGRLEKLIADLLDVSKISSGQLIYNIEALNFKELLEDTVNSIQLTAPSHRFIIKNNPLVSLMGDKHRLEQLLSNYLSNAVKYSPGSNEVIINSDINEGRVIVSVQDFGIGIAREHQTRLFDRFYRIKNAERTFQGLGLGLYVASEIVKRHNGSFWIDSEPGKGSTFFFTLPIGS
jgi:signal transduction histidine kinase